MIQEISETTQTRYTVDAWSLLVDPGQGKPFRKLHMREMNDGKFWRLN